MTRPVRATRLRWQRQGLRESEVEVIMKKHQTVCLLHLSWLLVLLASLNAPAAELVRIKEGGYRFRSELYEAVVDGHGRLASLQVSGQEILSSPATNAKVYGAALVAGPEHRTPLDLPRITSSRAWS